MSEQTSESTASKANGIGPPVAGKKRQFSDDYKRGVVARVKKGEAANAVADELRISGSVVRRWVVEAKGSKKSGRKGVSFGPGGRTVYSDDFRRAAVKRLDAGESATELADELKIHNSMLYNWKRKLEPKHERAPAAKSGSQKYSAKLKTAALKRYHAGERAADIAKDLKLPKHAVYDWESREKKLAATAATSQDAPKAATVGAGHGGKATVSYLKHALTAKSERVRVALITLALATLEGEL
jgi:transposase-like protein